MVARGVYFAFVIPWTSAAAAWDLGGVGTESGLAGAELFQALGLVAASLVLGYVLLRWRGSAAARNATDPVGRGIPEARWRLSVKSFEQASFAAAVVDAQSNVFLDVNPTFARERGYARQDMIGMPVGELYRPEDLPGLAAAVARADADGHAVFESVHRRRDGSCFPVEFDLTVTRDAHGRALYRIGHVTDLTARRRDARTLLDSARRYRNLFVCSPDAILITVDARITMANDAMLRLLGADAEDELAGRDLGDVLTPVPPVVHCAANLAEQSPPLCTGMATRLDGERIEVETLAAAFEVDGRPAAHIIVRDIRERRRLERELVEASSAEQERIGHEIHDGIGQRLTALNLLAAAIEEQLVSGRGVDRATVAALRDNVAQALHETRALARGLSPVHVGATGLVGALRELAADVRASAGLACDVAATRRDLGIDDLRGNHLFRIAQEAIHNAVKHAGASSIRVAVVSTPDAVELIVRDDGEGMSQAPAAGDGIGLTTMRARAALIGAALSVGPGAHGGTEVRCTLPLPAPAGTMEFHR